MERPLERNMSVLQCTPWFGGRRISWHIQCCPPLLCWICLHTATPIRSASLYRELELPPLVYWGKSDTKSTLDDRDVASTHARTRPGRDPANRRAAPLRPWRRWTRGSGSRHPMPPVRGKTFSTTTNKSKCWVLKFWWGHLSAGSQCCLWCIKSRRQSWKQLVGPKWNIILFFYETD